MESSPAPAPSASDLREDRLYLFCLFPTPDSQVTPRRSPVGKVLRSVLFQILLYIILRELRERLHLALIVKRHIQPVGVLVHSVHKLAHSLQVLPQDPLRLVEVEDGPHSLSVKMWLKPVRDFSSP